MKHPRAVPAFNFFRLKLAVSVGVMLAGQSSFAIENYRRYMKAEAELAICVLGQLDAELYRPMRTLRPKLLNAIHERDQYRDLDSRAKSEQEIRAILKTPNLAAFQKKARGILNEIESLAYRSHSEASVPVSEFKRAANSFAELAPLCVKPETTSKRVLELLTLGQKDQDQVANQLRFHSDLPLKRIEQLQKEDSQASTSASRRGDIMHEIKLIESSPYYTLGDSGALEEAKRFHAQVSTALGNTLSKSNSYDPTFDSRDLTVAFDLGFNPNFKK